MREETSLGGNLGDAVRIGDTVHRRAGPWTPAVHALLRFLERAGFDAPRVVGMDAQGREVLRFMPGTAHAGTLEPLPDHVFAAEHLVRAAKLLRRYHDIVSEFRPPPNARWRLVAPARYEVICHNDWSPWNALFRDGTVAAMLDWDLAGPGSRLWDVANAAHAWVPLIADAHVAPPIAERARRLALFLDAYGLEDRSEVLLTMRVRLQHVALLIERDAASGDPGMRRLVAGGTPRQMVEVDIPYLDRHWSTLEGAL